MQNRLKIFSYFVFFVFILLLPFTRIYTDLTSLIITHLSHQASMAAFFIIYLGCSLFLSTWPWLPLLAGSLFGFLPGLMLTLISSISGSTLAFLLGRYLFYEMHKMLFIRRMTCKLPLNYQAVLILLISPILPQRVINYLLGSMKLSLKVFLLATLTAGIAYLPPVIYLSSLSAKNSSISIMNLIRQEHLSVSYMLVVMYYLVLMGVGAWVTFKLFSNALKNKSPENT